MAHRVQQTRAKRRLLVPMRLPGAVGRHMAGGGLLPEGEGPRGKETFDQYLEELASSRS